MIETTLPSDRVKESVELRSVRLRPITKAEQGRWEQLMSEHHYLGWSGPVGESQAYVATRAGQWVALLAFGAPAYRLKDRDHWVGWSLEQRRRRLNFVVQNRRFLILPGPKIPNLASRVLGLAVRRLNSDWQAKYGHPVLLIETFVDPQRFEGTCYRAAGWERLGCSAGFGRARRDFYVEHEHPKEVWVKPLRRDAAEQLRAEDWPKTWQAHELRVLPYGPVRTEESRSLWEAFRKVPEFRQRRGIRYTLPAALACAACATLAGAKNPAEMAEIIAGFDQRHLRALRCFRNPRTGRYEAPSETTLRRVLGGINPETFDTVVAQWVRQQENPDVMALDGKAVKGCLDTEGRPLFLVSAVGHGSAAPCGQVQVESKTNEIPAARQLLRQMGPLDDVLITTDAAHTNPQTARVIVQEQGADYFLPLKGNQPSILQVAETLLPRSAFFPAGDPDRQGTRTPGTA